MKPFSDYNLGDQVYWLPKDLPDLDHGTRLTDEQAIQLFGFLPGPVQSGEYKIIAKVDDVIELI